MSTPQVSVVIPMFNAERYIGETIESVLAQSWRDFEIIVVDDGSTDAGPAIVQSFSDPRICLVRQENKGQTAALNNGLQHATGKYIQYLDADDLLGSRKLEFQLARLELQATSIATCEWSRFKTSPAESKFESYPCWADLDPLDWFVEDWLDGRSMMFPALWLIPTRIARSVGPWDESLTLNNDAEYFTRVLLASERVLFCPGAQVFIGPETQEAFQG